MLLNQHVERLQSPVIGISGERRRFAALLFTSREQGTRLVTPYPELHRGFIDHAYHLARARPIFRRRS